MTEQTKTNFYNNYKGLIIDRAHSLHKLTGFEMEELISEGNLIFSKCLPKFDPEKGAAFSTYLYQSLNYELSNFIQDQMKIMGVELSWAIKEETDPSDTLIFQEAVEDLNEDAKTIYDFIIGWKNKINKFIIQKYFNKNMGWTYGRTQRAFWEIEKVLGV